MTKSPLWTAAEAAQATGGVSANGWTASGVSIDSRTVSQGDLFVALSGPSFDGHDYVADALARGAAAAVVSHYPDGVTEDAPLLTVGDTFDALYDLGRFARDRAKARVIAVTGSVGKTGLKEALNLVLSRQGLCSASLASLNNHWGVPLTLARLPREADFAVVEMGMNHAGELAPLTRLARPHLAVVTTIEQVHSAHFDGLEAIAEAKAEIFQGLEPDGLALLNRDNGQYGLLAAAARACGARVGAFGSGPKAGARVLTCDPEGEGWRIRADICGTLLDYWVPLAGRHWCLASASLLATVQAVGADPVAASRDLADLAPGKGRGQGHDIQLPHGALRVIDESYNASPVSMAAAIAVLGRSTPGDGGRRIAVLGDMLELGTSSESLHRDLSGPIAEAKVDLVFTAGPEMEHLWQALPPAKRGGHAATAKDLVPLVQAAVRAGDLVMIKGSRGSRTDLVVTALCNMDGGAPERAANGD
ncbi:UDP-N-acetylmuramoylalanyl-D-glutamyl-2,6-diaminopimelate--D-alanyl-D-alanine ligase [Magnetospira sp. QH-2]|uniref:UDP-N-acetylmuramoylalanyl-D-glutamyl-2, 6-diaminopimelate--D-alanyl-D-alanine ligase n=1 Tax=Magnetospira sp. (strain QH-2) TaxID=1288970 RepID=UPI0003E80CC5|nr:UDP-N-acetylmuramoylalanyl-D-glutamyl-2,6-diaminopimelate--D-alanyl-D-alanine ligase [Magnetospira sp. QH-2]CCQ72808.1 UDP-N-acetylmuramoyl-tripeptide--D-alanyl-D-alanine ligase [Magnetospira sp. QH-2]